MIHVIIILHRDYGPTLRARHLPVPFVRAVAVVVRRPQTARRRRLHPSREHRAVLPLVPLVSLTQHAHQREAPRAGQARVRRRRVGATERELTEKKIPYEVGHAMFRHLARAQISGETVGMLKLLFHRETLQVLGIHCFGSNASEIVHIGQAIMAQPGERNTMHYFATTTFNYPTMAEAYRVAALNGLNRLF